MLNFFKSGGIRESYFFNLLETPMNAQILKIWLFPHCPHQSENPHENADFFIPEKTESSL